MSKTILATSCTTQELQPAPIPSKWILAGSPAARCTKFTRSDDWTSHVVVWDCTPGTFSWYYDMDETIVIISGEAFMTTEQGEERRFAAGDLGFFPAGTRCTWRITETLRKVGVLKENVGRPLGFGIKACHKLLRIAGLKQKSPI